MTDSRGHPVRDVFVYDCYRQQSVLALVNPDGCFHNQIAVVTVNQLVDILFFPVITHEGHRVAVFPDGQFQQFHLRGSNDIRVIAVGHDFLDWHGLDVIRRTFKT